jgi:hypothetical protein
MEVVAGTVLLLAALGLIVQVLAANAAAERAVMQKTLANELLSNLMEEEFSLSWSELTAESISQLKLPAEATQLLPGAELDASLNTIDGPPQSKKIVLELTWLDASGQRGKPLMLSAWRYVTFEEDLEP